MALRLAQVHQQVPESPRWPVWFASTVFDSNAASEDRHLAGETGARAP